MVGKLLAGILKLIAREEYDKASEQLENIYYDVLKQDASFFKTLPEEQLSQNLLEEHNYTNDHLEVLAELFLTESELAYVQGNWEQSLEFSKKSLILFEFIDREMKTYSADRIEKMAAIRKRIEKLK